MSSAAKLATRAFSDTVSMVVDQTSPLVRSFAFTPSIRAYAERMAAFVEEVERAHELAAGEIMAFPTTVRSSVSVLMEPVHAAINSIERLESSIEVATAGVPAAEDIIGQLASLPELLGQLTAQHTGNYSELLPLLTENLGAIQTVVQTIDAVVANGGAGFSLDAMRQAVVSYIQALLPDAKQTILREAATAIEAAQETAMQRFRAILSGFNMTGAQLAGMADALDSLQALPSLVSDGEQLIAASVDAIAGDGGPTADIVARLKQTLGTDVAGAVSEMSAKVAEFVAGLTSAEQPLGMAQEFGTAQATSLFNRLGRDTLPQGVAGVLEHAHRLSDATLGSVTEHLVRQFTRLGDTWTRDDVQAAFVRLILPPTEPFVGGVVASDGVELESVWATATTAAKRYLGEQAALQVPKIHNAANTIASGLLSTLPDLGGDFGSALRTAIDTALDISARRFTRGVKLYGVTTEELVWDAAVALVSDVGTPDGAVSFHTRINQVGDELMEDVMRSQLDRVATAFENAALAVEQDMMDANGNVPDALQTAYDDITAMASALARLLGPAMNANAAQPWLDSMRGVDADSMASAAHDVVDFVERVYVESRPDIDVYFPGGVVQLRNRVSSAQLRAAATHIGLLVKTLASATIAVDSIVAIGGVIQPIIAGQVPDATTGEVPNVEAIASSISLSAGVDGGLLEAIQESIPPGALAHLATAMEHVYKQVPQLVNAVTSSDLPPAIASCRATMSAPGGVSTFAEALRVLHAGVGWDTAMSGALSAADAYQLLHAVVRVTSLASEHPEVVTHDSCAAVLQHLEQMLWPSLTSTFSLVQQLYGPLSKLNTTTVPMRGILQSPALALREFTAMAASLSWSHGSMDVGVDADFPSGRGTGWWLGYIENVITLATSAFVDAAHALDSMTAMDDGDMLSTPVHQHVQVAVECLHSSTEAAKDLLPRFQSMGSIFALADNEIVSVLDTLGQVRANMSACVQAGTLPTVIVDAVQTPVEFCANVTTNETTTQQLCREERVVLASGATCTPASAPNCTEVVCVPHLVTQAVTKEVCVPYLTLEELLAQLQVPNLLSSAAELGTVAQRARVAAVAALQASSLGPTIAAATLALQLSEVADELTGVMESMSPTTHIADKLPGVLATAQSRVSHMVRRAFALQSDSTIRDLLEVAQRAANEATSAAVANSAAESELVEFSSSLTALVSALNGFVTARPSSPLEGLLESGATELRALFMKASGVAWQWTVVTREVEEEGLVWGQAVVRLLDSLSIPALRDTGSVIDYLQGAAATTASAVCLDEAVDAAGVIQLQTGQFASEIPIGQVLAWLEEHALPAFSCASTLDNTVDASTVVDGSRLVEMTATIWETFGELVPLPGTPTSLAAAIRPTLDSVLEVARLELTWLASTMTDSIETLADALATLSANATAAIHDRDVRAQVALYGDQGEHPAAVLAAGIAAAAETAHAAVSSVASSLLAAQSVDTEALLTMFSTVSAVVQSLQAITSLAIDATATISGRDNTPAASLVLLAEHGLAALGSATADMPAAAITTKWLGDFTTQLLSSMQASSAAEAMKAIYTWVRNMEQTTQPSVSSVEGSLGPLASFVDVVPWLASLRTVHTLHSVALEAGATEISESLAAVLKDVGADDKYLYALPVGLLDSLQHVATAAEGALDQRVRLAGMAVRASLWAARLAGVVIGAQSDLGMALCARDAGRMFGDIIDQSSVLAAFATSDPTASAVSSRIDTLRVSADAVKNKLEECVGLPETTAELGWVSTRALRFAAGRVNASLQHVDTLAWCLHMAADAVAPPQCCDVLHANGVTPAECGSSCADLATNGDDVPPECCLELAEAGVASPSCPPMDDCAAVVDGHDVSHYTNDLFVTPELPLRCCFDERVRSIVEVHPTCVEAASTPTGCGMCLANRMDLGRFGWSVLADSLGESIPQPMPIDERVSVLHTSFAKLDGAIQDFAAGASARTTVLEALAELSGDLDAHSGPVAMRVCASQQGYGHWMQAATAAASAHGAAVAAMVNLGASIRDIHLALSPQWAGLPATERQLVRLGVTLVWRVLVHAQSGTPLPDSLAPLVVPPDIARLAEGCTDTCDASVGSVLVTPLAQCQVRDAMGAVRSALEFTTPQVASRLARTVWGTAATAAEAVHSADGLLAGMQTVANFISTDDIRSALANILGSMDSLTALTAGWNGDVPSLPTTVPRLGVSAGGALLVSTFIDTVTACHADMRSVSDVLGGVGSLVGDLAEMLRLVQQASESGLGFVDMGDGTAVQLFDLLRQVAVGLDAVPTSVQIRAAATSGLMLHSFDYYASWVQTMTTSLRVVKVLATSWPLQHLLSTMERVASLALTVSDFVSSTGPPNSASLISDYATFAVGTLRTQVVDVAHELGVPSVGPRAVGAALQHVRRLIATLLVTLEQVAHDVAVCQLPSGLACATALQQVRLNEFILAVQQLQTGVMEFQTGGVPGTMPAAAGAVLSLWHSLGSRGIDATLLGTVNVALLGAAMSDVEAALGVLGIGLDTWRIVEQLQVLQLHLDFMADVAPGLEQGGFDGLSQVCSASDDFGRATRRLVFTMAGSLDAQLAAVPGAAAAAVRTAIASGVFEQSATLAEQVAVVAHISALLGSSLPDATSAALKQLQVYAIPSMVGTLCGEVGAIEAFAASLLTSATAMVSLGASLSSNDWSLSVDIVREDVLPSLEAVLMQSAGPVVETWLRRGKQSLTVLLAAARTALDGLEGAAVLSTDLCSAAAVAAGSCPATTSIDVASALQLLHVSLDAVVMTGETLAAAPALSGVDVSASALSAALAQLDLSLLLDFVVALSAASMALSTMLTHLSIDEATVFVPTVTELLAAVARIGVPRVGANCQVAIGSFDWMGSTVEVLHDVAAIVADAVSQLAVGVGADSIALVQRSISAAINSVRALGTAGVVQPYVLVAMLRLEIANVATTASATLQSALLDLDTLLLPLSAPTVTLVQLPAVSLQALRAAVDSAIANLLAAPTPPASLVSGLTALQQRLSLFALVAPLVQLESSLTSMVDGESVRLAADLFDAIGSVASGDAQFVNIARDFIANLLDQALPSLVFVSSPVSLPLQQLLDAVSEAHTGIVSFMASASLPTLTLGEFDGPAPWVQLTLERVAGLLLKLPTMLSQLQGAVEEVIAAFPDVGDAVAGLSLEQARSVMPRVAVPALDTLLLVLDILGAGEELARLDVALPASFTACVDLLADTFVLRCTVSCQFDVELGRSVRVMAALADVVALFSDLAQSSSIASVFDTGLEALRGMQLTLSSSATDILGALTPLPAPLPFSSAGISIVGTALATLKAAHLGGSLGGLPEVASVVSSLGDLHELMKRVHLDSTPSGWRALREAISRLKTAIAHAGKHGWDLPSVLIAAQATGDVSLVASIQVLTHYVSIIETYLDELIGGVNVGLLVSTISAVEALALQRDLAMSLASLPMASFAVHSQDEMRSALSTLLQHIGTLTLAELGSVAAPELLVALREFQTQVKDAVNGAWSEAVEVALSTAFALSVDAEAAITAASDLLPFVDPSAYTASSAVTLNQLLAALSAWRASLMDVAHEMDVHIPDSFDSTDLGVAVQNVLSALGFISQQRVDFAPRAVAISLVGVSEILGEVKDISDLILDGATSATIQRVASALMERLQRLLLAAVLKQARHIVSQFHDFVSALHTRFAADIPAIADPDKTAATLERIAEQLVAARDHMLGPSATMLAAVDAGSVAVSGIDAFRLKIVGSVHESLESVRTHMNHAESVIEHMTVFLSLSSELVAEMTQMEAATNRIATVVVTEVSEAVQVIVGTFDALLLQVDTVEEVVLAAVRDVQASTDKTLKYTQNALKNVGGAVFSAVSAKLDDVNSFLATSEQNLDRWKELATLAVELSGMLSGIGATDNLRLEELSSALSSVVSGVEFVESRVAQLQDLRARIEQLFNQFKKFPELTGSFLTSVPSESATKALFAHVRSVIRQVQAQALRLARELSEAIVAVAEEAIVDVLTAFAEVLEPMTEAVSLAADDLASTRVSVTAVFNLVDRREWLAEAVAALTAPLQVPRVFASSLRTFGNSYLGGLPAGLDRVALEDSDYQAVSDACLLDPNAGFHAIQSVTDAAATLRSIRPAVAHMWNVSKELKSLVSVGAEQRCVAGASCGIETVGARLGSVASTVTSLVGGIRSLLELDQGAAGLQDAATQLAECATSVPPAVLSLQSFSQSFFSGQLPARRLVAAGLRDALAHARELSSKAEIVTSTVANTLQQLHTGLEVFQRASAAAISAANTGAEVFEDGEVWAEVLRTNTMQVLDLRDKLDEYSRLLASASTMQAKVTPLMQQSFAFRRTIAVRTPGIWDQTIRTADTLTRQMLHGRQVVASKRDILWTLSEKLAARSGLGREPRSLQPWGHMGYCSDDTTSEGVCLRMAPRSSDLYRNLKFPSMFMRFWYETIPAASNRGRFVRTFVSVGLLHCRNLVVCSSTATRCDPLSVRGVHSSRSVAVGRWKLLAECLPSRGQQGRAIAPGAHAPGQQWWNYADLPAVCTCSAALQYPLSHSFDGPSYGVDDAPFVGNVADVAVCRWNGSPDMVWTSDDSSSR